MSGYRKIGHSVYQCKYHVIWCPKYRFKVMEGEIRYFVRDVLRRLCQWKKLEIIQGNVQKDHVHLILEIPPKFSVSQIMGYLKGKSAIQIFRRFPKIKKKYWGMEFWSKGYCVSTVGLDENKVVKYVRWQQKRASIIEQQSLFETSTL